MIGRLVQAHWYGKGVVIEWAPLGMGMTDALVDHDTGHQVWHSSAELRPIDGKGPLPSRQEAQHLNDLETARSLKAIRAQLIEEWNQPWPGCEYGKALVGRALDGALSGVTVAGRKDAANGAVEVCAPRPPRK